MPQQVTQSTVVGNILHKWTIQEYDNHDRDTRWYIVMGILGVILILFGFFTGNFLFALIIILFAIILYLQSQQDPLQVPFKITDLGVLIGSRFYEYGEFENFYVIFQPPEVKSLYFEPHEWYRLTLHIPLLDEDVLEVRKTLKKFLDEDLEKEKEPYSEQFARNWRLH